MTTTTTPQLKLALLRGEIFLRHVATSNMDEVNVVSVAVGRCLDACCLLLDLLIRALSWLLRFLLGWALSFHSALAVSSAAHAAVHAVEGWLQTLGGVFESFKMVGHLFCHVGLRTKDLLHRGFTLGSCILRQTCEGFLIALSLVLYFVNTVVNIVLISIRTAVAGPVQKVAELALNLLTFLYSVWLVPLCCCGHPASCCWTSLGHGDVSSSQFSWLTHMSARHNSHHPAGLVVLNPQLPVLVGQLSLHFVTALPGARSIQTTFHRLYSVMLEPAVVRQEVHSRKHRMPVEQGSWTQTQSFNV
ncbi:hypothetical protein INR49_022535 [Caranx melampygus]|nr:hypothetical protein INR49_022535 [Caranx melampygus]